MILMAIKSWIGQVFQEKTVVNLKLPMVVAQDRDSM
jgi:23S rRNA C2498 (ribose-2'-O)-methylase RlmM